jgi:ABC-2 type transport system ATP-binding protein
VNAIRTERLTKYYGAVVGLEALTLDVPAGEIFGFLGPNGAGKTTTIRLLLDLVRATHGDAWVAEKASALAATSGSCPASCRSTRN